MHIPEIYLKTLNQKSVKLLRECSVSLGSEELLTELKNTIRKSQVVEMLSSHMIIAVSGLQGVGKSTLIKQLYDIGVDDYFPENLSRGECLPVLIREGSDGFVSDVLRFSNAEEGDLIWEKISAEEFKRTAMDPKADDLLLRLTVPRRHNLPDEVGFLLLPGFEPENNYWQELMRYALMASMTSVFVFNQIRYPEKANREAIRSIRETFKDSRPIYVLTRSDQAQDGNEALRQTVCSELEVHDPEQVICTGTDSTGKWKAIWIPLFLGALRNYGLTPAGFRTAQLASLQKLLSEELTRVLMKVRSKAVQLKMEQSGQCNEVRQLLESYDGSVRRTKAEFLKIQMEFLTAREQAAQGKLKGQIKERDAWDRIWETVSDWFAGSEHPLETEDKIGAIWSGCLDYDTRDEQLMVLNELVNRRLKLYDALPQRGDYAGHQKLIEGSLRVKELPDGEMARNHTAVESDLKTLFLSGRQDDPVSSQLRKTMQLVPALTLEYTRLGMMLNPILEASTDGGANLSERLQPTLDEFDFLRTQHGKLVGGIAIMLGIDAEDGTIDTIPALVKALGSSVTGSAVPIATAAAGLVGTAFLVSSVLNQVKKYQVEKDFAQLAMLGGIKGQLVAAYEEKFDDLMHAVREILEERLNDRYHVHVDFSRVERLRKAVADADESRKQLLERTSHLLGNPMAAL